MLDPLATPPSSNFNLNGISPYLSMTPQPQQPNAPPRISLPGPSRRPYRKVTRPSTAPAKEELVLLPSLPPPQSYNEASPPPQASPEFVPNYGYIPSDPKGKRPESFPHMQTVDEDDAYSAQGALNLGTLPSPFESAPEDVSSVSVQSDGRSAANHSDYDWATFISAYASGRWDPHRTPNPPRSYLVSTHPIYSPPTSNSFTAESVPTVDDDDSLLTNDNTPSAPNMHIPNMPDLQYQSLPEPHTPSTPSLSPSPNASIPFHKFRPAAPSSLSLPSHRLRNSFSNSSASCFASTTDYPYLNPNNSEVQTTAAAMRWAAARVNISPLALPSPEHELTDPMRGVTATIPGSHPLDNANMAQEIVTPGGTRKTRLTSFWRGTQDVDYGDGTSTADGVASGGVGTGKRLSTINASPDISRAATPPDQDTNSSINTSTSSLHTCSSQTESAPSSSAASSNPTTHLSLLSAALPASAPALRNPDIPAEDYFGDIEPLVEETTGSSAGTNTSITRESSSIAVRSAGEMGTMSVPALPRRVCLTRQTSSPLPISSPHEARYPGGRVASESITSVKAGRAAKEEQMFAELGYLAPPNPPDELERRRALYKFNIWNTGPDLNFDRIAHLAKLVFNTRGVVISLIDGNEQWFKSEWGIKTPSCARIHSFCAHAILQRGDEPMVVLDTHLDWRFAKNPLVTGSPNIRFYAGAPLRTQEGFNIGSLTVIDDAPREDFSPRQRHTLKEFAAIAMREMELWRDKIQLRIRDRIQNSMEQFSRECLEIDTEAQAQSKEDRPDLIVGASMDKVYDRAAKLVKRTLDVEGVIVMDVSHCEVLESMSAEGSVSVVMHYGDPQLETATRSLSSEEYAKLNAFFARHPDGKISEGIVPQSFRPFLPTRIQYALTVPIFNIDKRPFALLCAYNASDHTKRFLEGHELSYLRAIGVIILSAVLKRRMILADKAKSLFISNISHELRTPLHGILAAAELLGESSLNHSQVSFLQTVQACGTSLVETVNHVLDFTKLSGNSKSGGVENVIVPTKVDLMQLVEEAVDGCWIGHRARTAIIRDSGIGSVYSPPKEEQGLVLPSLTNHVETIVDIGRRKGGWFLKCEKGGIRRVLMNVFGNSLKFTADGFVHVVLRQLPHSEGEPPNKIKIELTVLDTGKGISQNFLKNQLFHPFSQENPLQTGTGLGLAIVNSIVRSESVGGKVDVWSEEGAGTEIKVTFSAEISEDNEGSALEMEPFKFDDPANPPTISLVGFNQDHKGVQLLHTVLCKYLVTWWGFELRPECSEFGEIVILNDDPSPVVKATEQRDTTRPFIILSASRGNPTIMAIAGEHERIGGFCRIVYKPGGPSRLRLVLNLCLHALKIGGRSQGPSPQGGQNAEELCHQPLVVEDNLGTGSHISRRNSEESNNWPRTFPPRPAMIPRSSTAHPVSAAWTLPSTIENDERPDPETIDPTISVGSGGTLLKSSVGTIDTRERRFRVLVVEDNSILRNLLVKWLKTKGYDFRDAVDGREGVSVYEQEGPFDVVLLDLSMPVLDGVGATAEIRQIESARAEMTSEAHNYSTRILALTGMSSLEDKRRAFEAGVDGYLVKPVAFKTLDEMFQKLGI